MRPPLRAPVALALAALAGCSGTSGDRSALTSPSPERRAAAVADLGGSKDDVDLAALLVAQHDPSALVRCAAARAFAQRRGSRSADALGELLRDPDPDVVAAAAAGLAAMPQEKKAREYLVGNYWRATPQGRSQIAHALEQVGTSLREAVDAEAKHLWERNVIALESGSLAERRGAAEEIGASGRSEAVKKLLPLVDASKADPMLAAAAARGLGAAGDKSARGPLEALLGEDQATLRAAAAEALGALGDPAAAAALDKAAVAGPGDVSAAAVDALAALPNAPEVGSALCDVAAQAADAGIAERAARAARDREADCPDAPFLARLKRGGADAVAALDAVRALRPPGDRARPFADRALQLFGAAGTAPELRVAAARALGELGAAPAVPALVRRAKQLEEKLADARQKWMPEPLGMARPAGFQPGPPSMNRQRWTYAILDDRHQLPDAGAMAPPPLQAERNRNLQKLLAGYKEDRPNLPELVDDYDPAEAAELAAAAGAAARLKAPEAADLLMSLSKDPDPTVRARALEGLGSVGSDAARARLVEALGDASPAARSAAAAALGRLGAAEVAPLAGASKGGDPESRNAIAQALADTGSPDAVPALAAMLSDYAAPAAAQGLARLGVKDAVDPLLGVLARPRAVGTLDAIDALGALGDARAGPALADMLTSDRPEVRAAAARALGKLRYDAASHRLEALQADYYGDVRRAAVEALARLPAGRR